MSTATQDLSKMAATGEKPDVQVKNVVSLFNAMSQYLGQTSEKPTPDQETVISDIITDVTLMVNNASYQVGHKAEFKKWYALWMEEDVAIQSFYVKCASLSYPMFKAALVKAGTIACTHFHELRMRLTVNMFGGMGIGYSR
ncbi:hypothetical protein FRC08_015157 [Ceratobasidium sp. 394]|nr:hypothetical protein FRC08_015157 [Ceratobasidium sp. 394]